jgi:uncharacterized protein YbjT (DUF2867 family)
MTAQIVNSPQVVSAPRTVDASGPPIMVTGGTGTLGRLVVDRLLEAGYRVRVLSRGRRITGSDDGDTARPGLEFVTADLLTGEGVTAAMKGIEVVVHCAGSAKRDDERARQLVAAALEVGVRHIVYISVVGDEQVLVRGRIDRAMFGYFAAKRAAEEIIEESGIPWTTLHATQFLQSFLALAKGMARLPIMPVPKGLRFQPIDAEEVADRLAELAQGAPAGVVQSMGGPRTYEMGDLVRVYLQATGKHRLVIGAPAMGGSARLVRYGANLVPDRAVGRTTWEEFVSRETATNAPHPVET